MLKTKKKQVLLKNIFIDKFSPIYINRNLSFSSVYYGNIHRLDYFYADKKNIFDRINDLNTLMNEKVNITILKRISFYPDQYNDLDDDVFLQNKLASTNELFIQKTNQIIDFTLDEISQALDNKKPFSLFKKYLFNLILYKKTGFKNISKFYTELSKFKNFMNNELLLSPDAFINEKNVVNCYDQNLNIDIPEKISLLENKKVYLLDSCDDCMEGETSISNFIFCNDKILPIVNIVVNGVNILEIIVNINNNNEYDLLDLNSNSVKNNNHIVKVFDDKTELILFVKNKILNLEEKLNILKCS